MTEEEGQFELPFVNSAFSTTIPTLQTAWDSTSIGEAKLCWQRYKYAIIDGYQPRDTNVHLRFGTEYHHALEHYDHLKATGWDHRAATEEVVSDLLRRTWDKGLSRPWPSEDVYKNRGTLLRSVTWYLAQFEDDPLETYILKSGKPAVELHFDSDVGIYSRLTGEAFHLVGHLDKIALDEGRLALVDRKTTKAQITSSYYARFNPDNQVSTYLVGAHSITGEDVYHIIIDAAQVLVHSTRFDRRTVSRVPAHLDEWIENIFEFFKDLENRVEANRWPMNDKACGIPHVDPKTDEVRYDGCPFRGVCAAAPSMRELLLKTNFSRRTWDPTKPRELVRSG